MIVVDIEPFCITLLDKTDVTPDILLNIFLFNFIVSSAFSYYGCSQANTRAILLQAINNIINNEKGGGLLKKHCRFRKWSFLV